MRSFADLFTALEHSNFRKRFKLGQKEMTYLRTGGMEKVLGHAKEFIEKRLAPAHPANDGKQTPLRNHPVFIAQHATGSCCRGCLEKWHHIPRGRELTAQEQEYVVTVLGEWLSMQLKQDHQTSRG